MQSSASKYARRILMLLVAGLIITCDDGQQPTGPTLTLGRIRGDWIAISAESEYTSLINGIEVEHNIRNARIDTTYYVNVFTFTDTTFSYYGHDQYYECLARYTTSCYLSGDTLCGSACFAREGSVPYDVPNTVRIGLDANTLTFTCYRTSTGQGNDDTVYTTIRIEHYRCVPYAGTMWSSWDERNDCRWHITAYEEAGECGWCGVLSHY
jgi:hypothetical protein